MSDRLAIHFILVCDTPQGPRYVQHLNAAHQVSALVDDPSAAMAFDAQACQCDEAYFIIEPRLHGSVWDGYRPVAIVPRDHPPHAPVFPVCPPSLWSTWARLLLTFAKAMSTSLGGRLAAHKPVDKKACPRGLCTAKAEKPKTADKDVMQVYCPLHVHDRKI
jgi:hypothetical protein